MNIGAPRPPYPFPEHWNRDIAWREGHSWLFPRSCYAYAQSHMHQLTLRPRPWPVAQMAANQPQAHEAREESNGSSGHGGEQHRQYHHQQLHYYQQLHRHQHHHHHQQHVEQQQQQQQHVETVVMDAYAGTDHEQGANSVTNDDDSEEGECMLVMTEEWRDRLKKAVKKMHKKRGLKKLRQKEQAQLENGGDKEN